METKSIYIVIIDIEEFNVFNINKWKLYIFLIGSRFC